MSDCINNSLSDTNCTISSVDGNAVIVTSSKSYVPNTHDKDNGPVTSQPAHTQAPDNIGLIAAVAAVIIVLLAIIIVSVVIMLLVKKRYYSNKMCHSTLSFYFLFIRKWQRQKNQSYEMVSDLPKPKSSTEMASAHCESKTSSLPLKPTIEDIHDCSENEKDTPNKTSMKNVLYEPGK